MIEQLFSGKIRAQLLTKLYVNPERKVHLRGLERDLSVSSNTVRLELNKLLSMQLIQVLEDPENNKVKNYSVNKNHPMFSSIRGIILQFVGLDQIVDQVIKRVGDLHSVYLTGDLAEGNNSPFIDLVMVGNINKSYLFQLIEKAEPLIQKKIRVAIYTALEFNESILDSVRGRLRLV